MSLKEGILVFLSGIYFILSGLWLNNECVTSETCILKSKSYTAIEYRIPLGFYDCVTQIDYLINYTVSIPHKNIEGQLLGTKNFYSYSTCPTDVPESRDLIVYQDLDKYTNHPQEFKCFLTDNKIFDDSLLRPTCDASVITLIVLLPTIISILVC